MITRANLLHVESILYSVITACEIRTHYIPSKEENKGYALLVSIEAQCHDMVKRIGEVSESEQMKRDEQRQKMGGG